MIREALDELRRSGAAALVVGNRSVEYFVGNDLQRRQSDLLAAHTGYLCAVLGEQSRIGFDEVYAKLGFVPAERPMSERELLMERLGWPTETLTLEELHERVAELQ